MMNQNIKNMLSHTSPLGQQTLIREVLQQVALLGLERTGFFKYAAFYGGTALRILYGLDRFSEDLDFTLLKPDPKFEFEFFLDGLRKELESFGFTMDVKQKQKTIETSVQSAFLKINTIQLMLAIGDEKKSKNINHNEKIQIKLEIDTTPIPVFRVQNRLVMNPVSFYVLTLHPADLFAGKMHALLFRSWKGRIKGRDWYDLSWYIQKKIPLSLNCLQECMRQAEQISVSQKFNRELVIEMVKSKAIHIDWKSAKADMRPFISDPDRLDIWSPHYFTDLIEHLLVE